MIKHSHSWKIGDTVQTGIVVREIQQEVDAYWYTAETKKGYTVNWTSFSDNSNYVFDIDKKYNVEMKIVSIKYNEISKIVNQFSNSEFFQVYTVENVRPL